MSDEKRILQLIFVINRLSLKAFSAESLSSLIFIILNDTIRLVQYDRALLWDLQKKDPALLGVSGQPQFDKKSLLAKKWHALVSLIANPGKPQILRRENFEKRADIWDELQGKSNTTVLWLPIFVDQKPIAGLWLELWHYHPTPPPEKERELALLNEHLIPAYAASWSKLRSHLPLLAGKLFNRQQLVALGAALLLALFLIRVPLRIVAPCEVVPRDPVLITAPLQGVIKEVLVDPGERVRKGHLLAQYEKEAPLQNLKAAEKEAAAATAELNRAMNLGEKDLEARSQISILELKRQKAEVNLALLRYEAGRLDIPSPIDGVVILENRDEWRGHPVEIGQKIMVVTDPDKTKVRFWIPENDNVKVNLNEPIKVVLNITPWITDEAKITYIGNASTVPANNIPSFEAEADWVKKPQDARIGLKGSAILYGEHVSLIYFLFRKPWSYARAMVGF